MKNETLLPVQTCERVFKEYSDAFVFRSPATSEDYIQAERIFNECLKSPFRKKLKTEEVTDPFIKCSIIYEVGNFLVSRRWLEQVIGINGTQKEYSDTLIKEKAKVCKNEFQELFRLLSKYNVGQESLDLISDEFSKTADYLCFEICRKKDFIPLTKFNDTAKSGRTGGFFPYFNGLTFKMEPTAGNISLRPIRHLFSRLCFLSKILSFPKGTVMFFSGIYSKCLPIFGDGENLADFDIFNNDEQNERIKAIFGFHTSTDSYVVIVNSLLRNKDNTKNIYIKRLMAFIKEGIDMQNEDAKKYGLPEEIISLKSLTEEILSDSNHVWPFPVKNVRKKGDLNDFLKNKRLI